MTEFRTFKEFTDTFVLLQREKLNKKYLHIKAVEVGVVPNNNI